MADPNLETALRELESTAIAFGLRFIKMAEIRTTYTQQIAEMSKSIKYAVESGELSATKGAELAHGMRNEILKMGRSHDFDLGRALAQSMKKEGIAFEKALASAMDDLKLTGKAFETLPGADQNRVLIQVIEKSGHSRPSVTAAIPKLRWAGRSLWVASLLIAGYNIGTSEHPAWQTGRETANIAGGVGGSFAGGAAMGAAVGIWGGPVGVAVGIVVGGILGALLADRAYVEVAGAADPATRAFIGRFTSFWTGTDEDAMAKALATEYRTNAAFVHRVFISLNEDYTTDADDIALACISFVKKDSALQALARANPRLRDYLIQMMRTGYTTSNEQAAINYLRGL
jgi:hypothetical protein